MTIPDQNFVPNDPELKDVLNLFSKDIFLRMNCHAIGQIQAFNALKQTATVTINYKKTYFDKDPVTGVNIPRLENYPILADCPVIVLGGSGGAITFPIQQGDDCLILFNDRDIDNWFQGSTTSPVNSSRLHSFADGIIIVGLRSIPNVLLNYDTDGVTIRTEDGLTKLKILSDGSKILAEVGPTMSLEIDETGKLKITNGVTEFVSALSQLFTDIQNATTNTVFGPQPLIMPTFTTDKAAFDSFKS